MRNALRFFTFTLFIQCGTIYSQTVVFEDNFKDNKNHWPQAKTTYSDIRLNPGREMYMIKYKLKETADACTSWIDVDLDEDKNFRISALLYKEGGVKNYGYGLLWGGTEDNYYSFLVSPGGFYSIGKVVDGIWQDLTPDWVPCDAVEQGRKGHNKLALSKIGDTYHFEINNQKVATMKMGPFFGNKIGFNVNNKQKIMVDWIKVEYL
jgi:hypothetical protein